MSKPTPASAGANASPDLADYEDTFRIRHQQWLAVLARNAERLARGQYSLHWLNTDQANWGPRAQPSSRGLTFADVNRIEPYGEMPDTVTWKTFAARGSVRDPYASEMPIIEDYVV